MLIKVITNTDSTRIITDVTNIDISNKTISSQHFNGLWPEAYKIKKEPKLDCPLPVNIPNAFEVKTYDSDYADSFTESTWSANVIDYEKDGHWYRLIVVVGAYICNDDGKTIAKVGF